MPARGIASSPACRPREPTTIAGVSCVTGAIPARPVGELAGGYRNRFSQLRQPPLMWSELVDVRLILREAAAHEQFTDEFSVETATPLRWAESLPIQSVGDLP